MGVGVLCGRERGSGDNGSSRSGAEEPEARAGARTGGGEAHSERADSDWAILRDDRPEPCYCWLHHGIELLCAHPEHVESGGPEAKCLGGLAPPLQRAGRRPPARGRLIHSAACCGREARCQLLRSWWTGYSEAGNSRGGGVAADARRPVQADRNRPAARGAAVRSSREWKDDAGESGGGTDQCVFHPCCWVRVRAEVPRRRPEDGAGRV